MTPRFLKLISSGFVPLCLLSLINSGYALTFFILFNLICLCLLVMDMYLSPKEDVIEIKREENDTLYFKTANKIEFSVTNIYYMPLIIELKDEMPDLHFQILDSQMKKRVEPGESQRFYYETLPSKRGSYPFNAIYVRYDGIWGLCRKYYTVKKPFEYKVYPNLKDISKYRLIMQNHRLLTAGSRRVRLRGQGTEYESMREYVEGDDYRKINWLATARENKFIVNQYEAEKNQPVYILVDTGRPMSYSIRGFKKLDYAINASIILSDIVNQKGDNSGLMVFSTDVLKVIPPGKGASHRNEIMDALYHIEDTKLSSDYEGAFMELISKQKRRGIVFIFTDFETGEEAKELMAAMPILSRRHIPVIITLENESLKNAATARGNSLKDNYNKAMAEGLILNREKIMRILNQRGVSCIESRAEDLAIDAINRYLTLKERHYA